MLSVSVGYRKFSVKCRGIHTPLCCYCHLSCPRLWIAGEGSTFFIWPENDPRVSGMNTPLYSCVITIMTIVIIINNINVILLVALIKNRNPFSCDTSFKLWWCKWLYPNELETSISSCSFVYSNHDTKKHRRLFLWVPFKMFLLYFFRISFFSHWSDKKEICPSSRRQVRSNDRTKTSSVTGRKETEKRRWRVRERNLLTHTRTGRGKKERERENERRWREDGELASFSRKTFFLIWKENGELHSFLSSIEERIPVFFDFPLPILFNTTFRLKHHVKHQTKERRNQLGIQVQLLSSPFSQWLRFTADASSS